MLECFRVNFFNKLNYMYNPKKNPHSQDMLIKHWCKSIEKCSEIVQNTLSFDFGDVCHYHKMVNLNKTPKEIGYSLIETHLIKIEEHHSNQVTLVKDYLNQLDKNGNDINIVFDKSFTSINYDELCYKDLASIRILYDQQLTLKNTYKEIYPDVKSTSRLQKRILDIYWNTIIFKIVMRLTCSYLFISRKCSSPDCDLITRSACGFCKSCRKVEHRTLPFDSDWVYL